MTITRPEQTLSKLSIALFPVFMRHLKKWILISMPSKLFQVSNQSLWDAKKKKPVFEPCFECAYESKCRDFHFTLYTVKANVSLSNLSHFVELIVPLRSTFVFILCYQKHNRKSLKWMWCWISFSEYKI